VFAKNNDGTVTAVIEIQYQGPSEKFSWLLPISSVPKGNQIAVASNVAFQRLQQATNPQYTLTTRVEGECDADQNFATASGGFATGGASAGPPSFPNAGGVNVEAMGVVGAFEWTVISLEASLPNPADSAVKWLTANGYDVPSGAPGLIGPYLADGMYLLALRLVKGADAGSIRPLVLTYDGTKPMIPIKLTAVAANENMGVMTWVLGEAQAIPQNYNALVLNEARINWFNASLNYNDVVTAAANDAGGQGFVTEYAQPSANLKDLIWSSSFDESNWQAFRQQPTATSDELFFNARNQYSGMDGFWDVVKKHVVVPAGVPTDFLMSCTFCGTTIDKAAFLAALEADMIQPMRLVQALIDAHPQITRLYTTLSAAEMTVDPLFAFNAELPPVDNRHTAERIIECAPGYVQSQAPWRIELPNMGGVVRGGPNQINTWPDALSAAPANQRIVRQGETGTGKVLEDNSAKILASMTAYNASLQMPTPGGSANPTGTAVPNGTPPGMTPLGTPGTASTGGGGCSASSAGTSSNAAWGLLGLLAFGLWTRTRNVKR